MSQKQAQAATVAEVDGGALKGAALQRWLLKDDSFPGPAVANTLVSSWINTALLISDLRKGRTFDDSATVDSVILPDADRGTSLQFFQARYRARPAITDAQADSLATAGNVRVFQQIVLRIPPKPDSQVIASLRDKVSSLTKQARGGADFTALVKQASQDSLTRANNGYLPAVSAVQLQSLPTRMRTIWQLEPGEISEPLVSPVGIHIMRRATKDESRAGLKAWLAPLLARRADSIFVDSIVRARHVVIAPDARPRLRALAREPVTVNGTEPFATWQGGALTPSLVRSATLMLDARVRTSLSNGSDSLITSYLNSLANQRILLSVVTTGPMPTPEARKALAPVYLKVYDFLRDQLTALPKSMTPADAATMFMDSVVAGKQRYVPLPGALAELVRNRANVTVDTSAVVGVYQAAVPEWQAAHASDSSKVIGAPAQPATPGLAPAGASPKPN
jgi:hypothetical protein